MASKSPKIVLSQRDFATCFSKFQRVQLVWIHFSVNWLSSIGSSAAGHFWGWSGFGPGWICSVLCLLTRGSGSVSPRKMSRKQPIEDSQVTYLRDLATFRNFVNLGCSTQLGIRFTYSGSIRECITFFLKTMARENVLDEKVSHFSENVLQNVEVGNPKMYYEVPGKNLGQIYENNTFSRMYHVSWEFFSKCSGTISELFEKISMLYNTFSKMYCSLVLRRTFSKRYCELVCVIHFRECIENRENVHGNLGVVNVHTIN